MLILSRHQGESLILSEGDSQITVSLLKVENEQLKIAISTPDEERMIQQELLHLTE
ncbi:MAG: carbon storage regulator [Gammaproteobacteria bacterium]|nr:carbon storage regulator [Gammaproteobacteria bacterium]